MKDAGTIFFVAVFVVLGVALGWNGYMQTAHPPAPSDLSSADRMKAIDERVHEVWGTSIASKPVASDSLFDRVMNERIAKETIQQMLKDPDSAQFRDVGARGNVICGMVNAKNGFGGYEGFEPFSFNPTTRMAAMKDKLDAACR